MAVALGYRVRIPRGIAARWKEIHSPRRPMDSDDDPGVTFRVSDLGDGVVPTSSTVSDAPPEVRHDVGLDGEHRDEVMATIAAAERSIQPDRLPLMVVLVFILVTLIYSSGLFQGLFADAREHLIQERIKRPRAHLNWSDRHGASREKLGLPPTTKRARPRAPDLFGF
jgi:hypothetical protein